MFVGEKMIGIVLPLRRIQQVSRITLHRASAPPLVSAKFLMVTASGQLELVKRQVVDNYRIRIRQTNIQT